MSSLGMEMPQPDEINYHEDLQWQRVARAKALIDPGDVLAVIDARIAAEPDPQAHLLYQLVMFYLDRQTAVDGAKLYDDCRQLVFAAIDSCLDEALEMED
jgi:hypothetical protein